MCYTTTTGSAPNRVFYIEWRAEYFGVGGTANFEAVFNENDQVLKTIYGTTTNGGTSSTEGVQDNQPGGLFKEYGCNGAGGSITPGLAVIYTPPGGPRHRLRHRHRLHLRHHLRHLHLRHHLRRHRLRHLRLRRHRLRHLRHLRHLRRHPTTAATTTATSATSATTTTSTATTASTASASGPLPCPESARAASERREAQDPGGSLLGRQGASRSFAPLAAWPRGEPVTAARHDQAPELPGQAGGRPVVNDEAT